MRVRIPPLERSLRTASRQNLSPRPDHRISCGECRKDYIASNAPGRGFESRRVHQMRARSSAVRAGNVFPETSSPRRVRTARRMPMGVHQVGANRPAVRIRASHQILVAGTSKFQDRANAGLDYMVRAPAQAGGRRFNSAPGQPGSSGNRLPKPRRPDLQLNRGECGGDYTVAGSNPAGSNNEGP